MLQMLSTEMPRSADGLPVLGTFLILECVISVVALAASVLLLCWAEYTIGQRPWNWLFLMFDSDYKNCYTDESGAAGEGEITRVLLKPKVAPHKRSCE